MTCYVLDRSSRSFSSLLARHPDRTLARHMGKIISHELFPHLFRNLLVSIRSQLPICCSCRCGYAIDMRPRITDFVLMRSLKSVF